MRISAGRTRLLLFAGLAFACEQIWGIEDTKFECEGCAGLGGSSGGGDARSGQTNSMTRGTGARSGAPNGGTRGEGAAAGMSGGEADPGQGGVTSGGVSGVAKGGSDDRAGGAGASGDAGSDSGAAGAEGGTSAGGGGAIEGGSGSGAAGSGSGAAGSGGGGAAGSGGGGSWSPASLQGLMLWLDASVGVTHADGAVLAWRDQSPAQHLAAPDYGFDGPRLDASALGGLPALRFDGTNDRLIMLDKQSLRVGFGDFALAMVISSEPGPDQPDDGRVLFSKQALDPPYPGIGLFLNAHRIVAYVQQSEVLESPVTGAIYDDNRVRIVGMQRRSNELSLRVNGVVLATVPVSIDASAVNFPLRLGAGYAAQYLHGLIGEVVLSRVDSNGDVVLIEQYLQVKYAAALADP